MPYVDVVHQAATEYVSPGPFDLPEVRAWTRRQGPNVGRRDVLSEIGAYVRDLSTGEATVSHGEIAQNLGIERKAVGSKIDVLETYGFLATHHNRDSKGYIVSTTYILAGVYSNWMTTVEVGDQDVTSAKYRQEQLLLQLEALAAQVIELGGVPVVDVPNRDRTVEREINPYVPNRDRTEEREREINPYVPKWDIGIAHLSPNPVRNRTTATSPTVDDIIYQFCVAHYDQYLARGRVQGEKGFDAIGGAMRSFRQRPEEFARWRGIVARESAEDGQPAALQPEGEAESTLTVPLESDIDGGPGPPFMDWRACESCGEERMLPEGRLCRMCDPEAWAKGGGNDRR